MLILKFRKYNNSLYKLSSDFQIVTVLGLQFIIFILQQLHNLITTALKNKHMLFTFYSLPKWGLWGVRSVRLNCWNVIKTRLTDSIFVFLMTLHSLLMVLCSGRDFIVLPIVIRSAGGCWAKISSPNWCPLNFDHFSLRKWSTLSSQNDFKAKMNAEFNWNPVSPSGYCAYFGRFCVCKNRRCIFALL